MSLPPSMPSAPQDRPDGPVPGGIAVNVTPIRGAGKVNVLLDGIRMVNQPGRTVYPAQPGVHMLSCELNSGGLTFGQVDLQVPVHPGVLTEVYYAPPWTAGGQGRIGFAPVRRMRLSRAQGCALGFVAVLTLLMLLLVLALILVTTRM